MDNKNIKSILQDALEEKIPSSQIELWPAVKASLVAGKTLQQGEKMNTTKSRRISRAAFITLTIIVLLTLALITPQGHAIAQDFLKYFTTSAQKWLPPWPMPAPVPTYTLETKMTTTQPAQVDVQGCEPVISPISSTFLCQLEDAQSKLGFIVKSFPVEYVDANFHAMEFNPENKTISLFFRGEQGVYTLKQGLGNFPTEPMGYAIYQDAIELTQVGNYPAEYAAGVFIFSEDNSMTWNPAEPVYHLHWKEDEKFYSFTMKVSENNGLTPVQIKEKMILIAENLVTLDQGAYRLTAGYQPSIKDSAGFVIKELGILPKMFHQVPDRGWSALIPNKVNTLYEYSENGKVIGFLEFSQIPIPANRRNLRWEFSQIYPGKNGGEDFIIDEEVQINGVTGYYLVPSGEFPPYALYWRDDEREYLLICQWSPDFGGRLSKEDLITIAESVK